MPVSRVGLPGRVDRAHLLLGRAGAEDEQDGGGGHGSTEGLHGGGLHGGTTRRGHGGFPGQGRRVSSSAGESARAGVERHLLAHVPARVGGAQVAHQVDDPVQLVGLEGQHPLVVAEGERATVLARTSA